MAGRRPVGAIRAVLVLLLLATGCGTDGDTSGPEGAEQGGVKPELVVGAPGDVSRVEPPFRANVATGGAGVNPAVFEPLVLLDANFTVRPLLARSWELLPPNTWRFHLRRDVRFHNGARFDAHAVAYNVGELWAKNPGSVASLGADSARVVDDFTIDLTPLTLNRRLVEQLVHPMHGVQAPGTFAGAGTARENRPTGTGPFKFVTYQRGQALNVERFDGYWDAKPRVERLTFRFMPDSASRVLALKAGEVDAVYDFPKEQVPQFANDPDIRTVTSPVGGYAAMLLNHRRTDSDLLSDLRIRQAIAIGIDRHAIVENVWKDTAEVTNTLIPPAVLADHARAVRGYPFDRRRAEQLLAEAGWVPAADGIRTNGGRRLELVMVVAEADVVAPLHELAQAQLKAIGIDVKLDAPTPEVYGERLVNGEGDIFVEVGSQNDANPAFLGALFTGAASGFPDYAMWFGVSTEYDELFTRAVESANLDEARRLAAECMRLAVDQLVAAIPVAGIARVWGVDKDLSGFAAHPSQFNQRWANVVVSE